MKKHYPKDAALVWTEKEAIHRISTPLFEMYDLKERSADGAEATFLRLTPPDWVNVVAPIIQEDGTRAIIVVRQYRHGLGELVTELPAGVVDEGESPEHAALRELEEETGHRADSFVCIGDVCPNPSFMNNRAYTYLAQGVRPCGEQNLDEFERLHWFYYPEDEIDEAIKRGEFDNGVILAAWAFYQQYKLAEDC